MLGQRLREAERGNCQNPRLGTKMLSLSHSNGQSESGGAHRFKGRKIDEEERQVQSFCLFLGASAPVFPLALSVPLLKLSITGTFFPFRSQLICPLLRVDHSKKKKK